MFPLHIKLTVSTHAELARLSAFLESNTSAAVAACPKLPSPVVTAEEKAALMAQVETALADTVDPAAAPEQKAEKPAAPPTEPPAAAPSASSPAPSEPFQYATLQRAVNQALPKHGKDALLAIAKKHGGSTFKDLAADKWAAAHADVVALGV